MRKWIGWMGVFLLIATFSAQAKPTWPPKPEAQAVADAKAKAEKAILLEIDGKVYPKDSFPETCKDMFKGGKCPVASYGTYHNESRKEGDLIYSRATFSANGEDQQIEESWEKDGHVQRAVVQNNILGKKCELEVKDGKAIYKVTEKDGKVKTSEDDAESNLVVPSTIMSYVRPHFPDLMAGKEVKLKVAVLDRRESFTFYMKKLREEKSLDGKTIMVLEMTPGSIIVKAFVDKMLFYVRPEAGEMFAFEGKSALRRKEGEKYKDMLVNTAYEYKINAFNNVSTTAAKKDDCDFTATKCEVKAE
jgi:hypothetical protein